MKSLLRLTSLALLWVCFSGAAPPPVAAFDEPMKTIGTGNVTGVYYAAGSAVAKMHNQKRKEYNLRLIVEASEGSIANIENVTEGAADFGISQANALYFASRGERFWENKPQAGLRAVLGLHIEALTIVAGADVGIEALADLKGKRVNIGELGSTDAMQARGILNYVGLDPEQDLTVLGYPTYQAAELLQRGEIDAYFYTAGHPNLAIKEAAAGSRPVVLISPGREFIDLLANELPYLSHTSIPIDYYQALGNREPVPSVGVKAILFTTSKTEDEIVYRIVKEVYENFDLFKRQHPSFAALTPATLTSRLIVPLHPGAERYFKEVGLLR